MTTKPSKKTAILPRSTPTTTREILNRLSNPLIVIDKENQILFANQAAQKLNDDNPLIGKHLTTALKITPPSGTQNSLSHPIIFRLPNSDREGTASFLNVKALPGLHQVHKKARTLVILQTPETTERSTPATAYQGILGYLTLRIAHDFNNSLTSILSSAEYLKAVLTPLKDKTDLPDNTLSFINEIIRKCMETAQTIDKLQDYARQQPRPRETIDLNEAIDRILSIQQPIIGKKIALEFIPTDDLPQFYGEHPDIDQLIISLLEGSKKTMPDGGRITIQTDVATLTEEYAQTHPGAKPGQYLLLTVTDTGTGIPKTSLTQSFELFQAPNPDNQAELHIPTAYAIVKHLSGYIALENWPGGGTKFEIYLPVHSAETSHQETTAPSIPKRSRPNPRTRRSQRKHKQRTPLILIAEDQRDVAQALSQHLLQAHYRTRIVHNGQTALDTFKELALHHNRPSMVIADLGLPGIDGRSLCKQIRSITKRTHLLLTTGYKIDLKEGNTKTVDGFNFLQKPFTANTLIAMVNKILTTNGRDQ